MIARVSLHRALLGTVVVTFVLSVVPAGIMLDRRLVDELETRERSDLEMAAAMVAGGTMRAAADPSVAMSIDALGRLTRSDVTTLSRVGIVRSTLGPTTAAAIADATIADSATGHAHALAIGGRRLLAVMSQLDANTRVLFTRDRSEDLAIIAELHRMAAASVLVALVIALTLGSFIASRIATPVRALSDAAVAMGHGEFHVPLPQSRIVEVARVAERFDDMRQRLDLRLTELREANDALADRSARLVTLQSDLMQRDRLTAGARLVGQLAHEIRNPVANLRNLLELIRRRSTDSSEVGDYADLAIAELKRMHGLAEQMLDLNRPRSRSASVCDPVAVATDVARLAEAGTPDHEQIVIQVHGTSSPALIAPDALKQVLVNLVQNAREAIAEAGVHAVAEIEIIVERNADLVVVTVGDNGPGIAAEDRARVFDPFYSTKAELAGVGLGLFVAEGLVRSAGGRLTVGFSPLGGALFRVELRPGTMPAAMREVSLESSHMAAAT